MNNYDIKTTIGPTSFYFLSTYFVAVKTVDKVVAISL